MILTYPEKIKMLFKEAENSEFDSSCCQKCIEKLNDIIIAKDVSPANISYASNVKNYIVMASCTKQCAINGYLEDEVSLCTNTLNDILLKTDNDALKTECQKYLTTITASFQYLNKLRVEGVLIGDDISTLYKQFEKLENLAKLIPENCDNSCKEIAAEIIAKIKEKAFYKIDSQYSGIFDSLQNSETYDFSFTYYYTASLDSVMLQDILIVLHSPYIEEIVYNVTKQTNFEKKQLFTIDLPALKSMNSAQINYCLFKLENTLKHKKHNILFTGVDQLKDKATLSKAYNFISAVFSFFKGRIFVATEQTEELSNNIRKKDNSVHEDALDYYLPLPEYKDVLEIVTNQFGSNYVSQNGSFIKINLVSFGFYALAQFLNSGLSKEYIAESINEKLKKRLKKFSQNLNGRCYFMDPDWNYEDYTPLKIHKEKTADYDTLPSFCKIKLIKLLHLNELDIFGRIGHCTTYCLTYGEDDSSFSFLEDEEKLIRLSYASKVISHVLGISAPSVSFGTNKGTFSRNNVQISKTIAKNLNSAKEELLVSIYRIFQTTQSYNSHMRDLGISIHRFNYWCKNNEKFHNYIQDNDTKYNSQILVADAIIFADDVARAEASTSTLVEYDRF